MATIQFKGGREDLRRLLRAVPAVFSGRVPDPYGIAMGLQLLLGVALLSRVQQAFLIKSRGGVGDDGIKWAPLLPSTIAQRRTTREERKALGITGKRTRGLLTPAQDKRWRTLFAREKFRLMGKFGMGEQEASAIAAKIAWTVLKSEGAQTKLALLGGRQVDIGRDTSRMFRSLSPGVQGLPATNFPWQAVWGQSAQAPERASDRICNPSYNAREVIVGTNVPYATPFHRRRRLWPDQLPAAWWTFLLGVLSRGILRAVELVLRRASP